MSTIDRTLHILEDMRITLRLNKSSRLLTLFRLHKMRVLSRRLRCEIKRPSFAVVIRSAVHGVPNAPVLGEEMQEGTVGYHNNLGKVRIL